MNSATAQNVAISAIDKELSKLRAAAEGKSGNKACLFNLILYSEQPRRTNYFNELLATLVEKFPCRIIFIQNSGDAAQNSLETLVSVESGGVGESKVSCDKILFKVSGKCLERIPYIILPTIIPDIPIYLFWGEDPCNKNETLTFLQKLATHCIFDSESAECLQSFSQNILNKMDEYNAEIIDMNWARTSGWRDILSKAFDSAESCEHLAQSKVIQICYNSANNDKFLHAETQAT